MGAQGKDIDNLITSRLEMTAFPYFGLENPADKFNYFFLTI